jgi:hypothetical protein
MLVAGNLTARDTLGNVMELGAISDHFWLSGLRGLNTVPYRSGG